MRTDVWKAELAQELKGHRREEPRKQTYMNVSPAVEAFHLGLLL